MLVKLDVPAVSEGSPAVSWLLRAADGRGKKHVAPGAGVLIVLLPPVCFALLSGPVP